MHVLWKYRSVSQHGVTQEDRGRILNEKMHPMVRTAYRTKNKDVSYYNMRDFSMPLEEKLNFYPKENDRWLEIVATAKKHRRLSEEAVMLAMRKISAYFPTIDK